MRPTKHNKIQKSGNRTKISKKKNTLSCRSCRCNIDGSIGNLENINEVLRINKTQRAQGRGSWKVLPKDSCEIYRERRRNKMESQNQHSDESLSEDSQKRSTRNKSREKQIDKRVEKKPVRNTRKNRRRPRSNSSCSSCTSCSSMSTSCASTSDMEC